VLSPLRMDYNMTCSAAHITDVDMVSSTYSSRTYKVFTSFFDLLRSPLQYSSPLPDFHPKQSSCPSTQEPSYTLSESTSMATAYSTFTLPDGATLAYEILGSYHTGRATPIVLICGMTSIRIDYERLTKSLIRTRPGTIVRHR